MELTLSVTFAVLGAALLHAAWNAIIKSGRDPLLDTALVALSGTLVSLPLLALVPLPDPASWPYLAASVAVHLGYYTALAGAYKAGDLSHGYPIMRGTAPLLVAAASVFWFRESLSLVAWAGVVLVSGGVLSLGMAGGGASRRATGWALLNAVIIAVYTIADGAGVRLAGSTHAYVVWLFLFMGLPFGLAVLAIKRGELVRHAAAHWGRGLAGALLSGLSYGIALWAMTRAPVAVVAALRETSVIFAALIGAWFLREGHLRARLAGAAVVLAGLIALKLPP
ncbi:MAG: EamA family transporter [Betaproteobacteria bacterium]